MKCCIHWSEWKTRSSQGIFSVTSRLWARQPHMGDVWHVVLSLLTCPGFHRRLVRKSASPRAFCSAPLRPTPPHPRPVSPSVREQFTFWVTGGGGDDFLRYEDTDEIKPRCSSGVRPQRLFLLEGVSVDFVYRPWRTVRFPLIWLFVLPDCRSAASLPRSVAPPTSTRQRWEDGGDTRCKCRWLQVGLHVEAAWSARRRSDMFTSWSLRTLCTSLHQLWLVLRGLSFWLTGSQLMWCRLLSWFQDFHPMLEPGCRDVLPFRHKSSSPSFLKYTNCEENIKTRTQLSQSAKHNQEDSCKRKWQSNKQLTPFKYCVTRFMH